MIKPKKTYSYTQESIKFHEKIQELVDKTGLSYIEVILDYCEKNSLEIEVIGKLINNNFRELIALEAKKLNLLKTIKDSANVASAGGGLFNGY